MLNRSRMREVDDTRQDFEELDSAISAGFYLKDGMNRDNQDFYYMSTVIEIISKRCGNITIQLTNSMAPQTPLFSPITREITGYRQTKSNNTRPLKLGLTTTQAKKHVKRENLRTAKSAYQEKKPQTEMFQYSISEAYDVPDSDIKNCQNSMSEPAESEDLDVLKPHPNQTHINKTYNIHAEKSQSVSQRNSPSFYLPEPIEDRQTDIYKLDKIIDNCELEFFDEEERKILYDAIERLFYSKTFRIGSAELPQDKVRSRLYELDGSILRNAVDSLHRNDREIKNITGYLMSTIFNAITEEYSLLHVDPYLNSFRVERRE